MATVATCGGLHTGRRITAANMVAAKIAQTIKAFWGDTDGVILPYVTVMLVVIMLSGSLWVMYHLNHKMMPGMMSESMQETMPESMHQMPHQMPETHEMNHMHKMP